MTDTAFPAIGHVFKADYGELVFRFAFNTDGKTLRWAPFAAEDFDAAARRLSVQVSLDRLPVEDGIRMRA